MAGTVDNNVQDLQTSWRLLFPNVDGPDARQWALWLILHGLDTVRQSIAKLAVRYERSSAELGTRDSLIKFASSIMNRVTREKKMGDVS